MNGAEACSMGMWFALPLAYLITWLWGRETLAWQLFVGLLSRGCLVSWISARFTAHFQALICYNIFNCTLNPDWWFTNQALLGGLFLHDAVLPFGSWNVTPAWLVHRSPMARLRTYPVLHLPFGSWNVTARLVHRSPMAHLRTCPVIHQVCQIRSAPLLRASRYYHGMQLVINDRNSKDVWIGSVHSFRRINSWSVHLMW